MVSKNFWRVGGKEQTFRRNKKLPIFVGKKWINLVHTITSKVENITILNCNHYKAPENFSKWRRDTTDQFSLGHKIFHWIVPGKLGLPNATKQKFNNRDLQ